MKSEIAKVLSRDMTMARLVKKYGAVPVRKRPLFLTLVQAVVSQQLSGAAASTILGRIEQRVGLSPAKLSRVRPTTLHSRGLSKAKSECLRHIAKLALKGEFDGLTRLSDDEVFERLTAIKGVGPWTAKVVMLGALARPDVWPVGDAGLQRAARNLYGVGTDGLEELGERFRPYRSHASWYFWQSLD